ncbi:MAG: lipid-A-disaccharide synthase, partial [Synergistaceae bacterium]|nr:lipid-A-disaccharide synthase [Synergistaceae bacterium]
MRVTILTNGPGELWGWVRPVASELRNRGHSISLWLLPCPFSSGHEREAASLLGVDKLEGPSSASVIWREAQHERTDRIIQMGGDISFGLRMSKFSKAPLTVYSYRHRKEIPGVKLLTAFPEQINLPSV